MYMNRENKKALEFNIAIALAIILLFVTLLTVIKNNRKNTLISKETKMGQKEISSKAAAVPLKSKESHVFEESTAVQKEEVVEKATDVTFLKDLPIDTIPQEKESPAPEIHPEAPQEQDTYPEHDTQPSPGELKALQNKKLIIY